VQPVQLKPHPGELTVVHHKQDLIHQGVDIVVVHKLSVQQELVPVILFVVCEDSDELLELLFDALCLANGLQVVSGRCCRLYTNEALQLRDEIGHKLLFAVGDVHPRGSVVPVLEIELSGYNNSETSMALVEVGPLTENINHNHHSVEPVCGQKLHHEVHRDSVPAFLWNFRRVKLTVGQLLKCLGPVA
jgi:hypothetical protein